MSTSDFFYIDRKPELLQEIGKVTIRWSMLDWLLMWVTATVLDDVASARRQILDTNDGGKKRLDTFKEIIGTSRLDQTDRQDLINLANQFASLISERNKIIHEPTVAGFTVQGKKISLGIDRVGPKGKRTAVDVTKITKHVQKVEKLLEELELKWIALEDKYCPDDDDVVTADVITNHC